MARVSVEFRNAIQIDPKDAQARILAVETNEKLGQLRGAFSLPQSVIDDHPENLEAHTQLGRLLVMVGDPKRVLEIIGPPLMVRSSDAPLLAVRSAAKAALRDLAGARADADLLDAAGWVQFKRGDHGKALPVLQRAAQLMPQSHEVHYHLGMAELRGGQPDRARTAPESALVGASRFFGQEDAPAALASLKSQAS